MPGLAITALTDSDSGGRAGNSGRSVASSPFVGRPTQRSIPSSYARYGLHIESPFWFSARPCQRQYMVPSMTGHLSSSAPRCGQAPGPAISSAAELRHKTTSRPAMVRVTDSFRPTSPLVPATNQPPELRDWAVRSAAAMRAGLASRQVEAIQFSRGCGTRSMGMRERGAGLAGCGRGLIRVLSDIGHTPSLVGLRLLLECAGTCHHDAGRGRSLAPGGYPGSAREHVVPFTLDLIKDLRVEHPRSPDTTR